MATRREPHAFLFAWNPAEWPGKNLKSLLAPDVGGRAWSVANLHARPRDRAFLIRLGQDPRGIVGAGTIRSEPYEDAHWDPAKADRGEKCFYVDIDWEGPINLSVPPLPLAHLNSDPILKVVEWSTRQSGIRISDGAIPRIEQKWAAHAIRLELIEAMLDLDLPSAPVGGSSVRSGKRPKRNSR